MNLQIKSLSGELSEDEKRYLRKRFLWLEEHVPNSSTLTVGVKQHITKRSNQAFEVVLHLIIPGLKRPIYIKEFKNSFTEAVDVSRARIERAVVKNREKTNKFSFKLKFPRLGFVRKKNESV